MAKLTRWVKKLLGRVSEVPTHAKRAGKDGRHEATGRPRSPTPRAVHERHWQRDPHERPEAHCSIIFVGLLGAPGIGRRSLENKLLYDDMQGGELLYLAQLMMEDEIPKYFCGEHVYDLDIVRPASDSVIHHGRVGFHDFFSVILAYDVYSQASLDQVSALYDTISAHQKSGQPRMHILILGLKADPYGTGLRVPRETGEAFAAERGCSFAECSAKSGDGVYEAFGMIVEYAHGTRAQFSGDTEGHRSFINECHVLLSRAMPSTSTT